MVILGGILIAVAVVLLVVWQFQQRKLANIRAVESSTARELALSAGTGRAQGGEPFRRMAEVNGLVRCDAPLISEITQSPCVYYETNVSREYEETYYETDSRTGRQEEKTRRSSDTVSSNSQRVEFWVEDATGRVLVNPNGASIDAVQVVDRFEPGEPNVVGGSIAIGGFTFSVTGLGTIGGPGTRTLGYRYREQILPLDRRVYVLGEASDSSGRLMLQQPRGGGKNFIISLKSEEELIRSVEGTIRWLLIGAAASGVVGLVLVVLGSIRR